MNKKALVVGLSVLAAMVVGIAVLIAVLFGGSGADSRTSAIKKSEPLFCAVPSNAVVVAKFSDLRTAVTGIAVPDAPKKGPDAFVRKLSSSIEQLPELSGNTLVVSMLYSRKLVPLFVLDAGRSSDADCDAEIALVSGLARDCGLTVADCDCSKILSVEPKLRDRRLLLVSPEGNVVNSALRHLNDGVSVYDSGGFAEVQGYVSSKSSLFVSASDADQILPEILAPSFRKYYKFLSSFSGWAGFEITFSESGAELYGTALSGQNTDFVNVLSGLKSASSEIFGMLPSYTVWTLSMPLSSVSEYEEAYDAWLDKLMKLPDVRKRREVIAKSAGMSPAAWFSSLKPAEIAVASFRCGDALRTVNLVRCRKLKDTAEVQPFENAGSLAALFGSLFEREDESCCAVISGWLVTGSSEAVEEWSSGRALEYSLYSKLCDAGLKSLIPVSGTVISYFSANEDASLAGSSLAPSVSAVISPKLSECDVMPMFLSISSDRKSPPAIDFTLLRADMKRSKAPETERDVHISVPDGPFTVKNSATGKSNTLVQNPNMTLSLRDESGKGVWTVPFSEKLCGTVTDVDYFANGKIQFLFGAGSKVWLLDRLGRFVKPFPVELGKKIVLGPAVYDFSGARKYNILVLHEDNSIRMYNFQGKVPEGWQDITSTDTIVSLPERVVTGQKSFWIVRTSRQTLVFPFMGGQTLTDFSGDSMLMPDTAVKVEADGSLSAVSYNGKTQKIKVK